MWSSGCERGCSRQQHVTSEMLRGSTNFRFRGWRPLLPAQAGLKYMHEIIIAIIAMFLYIAMATLMNWTFLLLQTAMPELLTEMAPNASFKPMRPRRRRRGNLHAQVEPLARTSPANGMEQRARQAATGSMRWS